MDTVDNPTTVVEAEVKQQQEAATLVQEASSIAVAPETAAAPEQVAAATDGVPAQLPMVGTTRTVGLRGRKPKVEVQSVDIKAKAAQGISLLDPERVKVRKVRAQNKVKRGKAATKDKSAKKPSKRGAKKGVKRKKVKGTADPEEDKIDKMRNKYVNQTYNLANFFAGLAENPVKSMLSFSCIAPPAKKLSPEEIAIKEFKER